MDYTRLFSDQAMVDELMDRLPELTGGDAGGLEGLDSLGVARRATERALGSLQEGRAAEVDPGLEAIIRKFARPAYFVQKNTFDTDGAPSTSKEVDKVVDDARAVIESSIPGVGRINLRDHLSPWVGTGWVVAPNVVVTNRHVARQFAEAEGDGFVFVESTDGRRASAELDLFREYREPSQSLFRMREVLWIEPQKAFHHDVAFLGIDPAGQDGEAQPSPLRLMTEDEYDGLEPGRWVGVIGYPAFDTRNDRLDQQRIFDGVFDVKRLQPGQITLLRTSEGTVQHDATTLGGNSGSVVVDLTSGAAAGLHYSGLEGENNYAVAAPVVTGLLRDKLGI
jgi:endonuclease G